MKDLYRKYQSLSLVVSKEKESRCSLQAIVKKYLGKDDNIQWPPGE